jgi:hypothetical protein
MWLRPPAQSRGNQRMSMIQFAENHEDRGTQVG